ncbi:MAG: GGDEF domain-containing protein [Deltaproteobacteria bacterium]|nr:GGDEF domain-containing protein [Deltaproteobacteria bacterium]MBW2648759.1 GGDEF domain-containing protein [Deltaproteobacteria bacterium]
MAKPPDLTKKPASFAVDKQPLREEEQLLKAFFESSPIPAFVIGKDRRIIYWNGALEKMSGIMAEDVIGSKDHWKAFYHEYRPTMADLIVDERQDEIPYWYPDKYKKSDLIEDAYEATDFFPALEDKGKWLRFTASALKGSTGTLIGAVETLEDITGRKLAEDALRESEARYRTLSITDALTGLYNSRHFYDQIRLEIERADRYGHPLSLLLLDIDNFKKFNDSYGHLEGDVVLVRLGEVIRRCLRKTDSAYRFGGEEFTVILPETTGDAATILAERIREEFENEGFYPLGGEEAVHKTVSIGVAQYISQEELRMFLKRVDSNMYRAKRQGKNRVFYGKR